MYLRITNFVDVGTNSVVVETIFVVAGTIFVVVGTIFVDVETSFVVNETIFVVVGTIFVVVWTIFVVVWTIFVAVKTIFVVVGKCVQVSVCKIRKKKCYRFNIGIMYYAVQNRYSVIRTVKELLSDLTYCLIFFLFSQYGNHKKWEKIHIILTVCMRIY